MLPSIMKITDAMTKGLRPMLLAGATSALYMLLSDDRLDNPGNPIHGIIGAGLIVTGTRVMFETTHRAIRKIFENSLDGNEYVVQEEIARLNQELELLNRNIQRQQNLLRRNARAAPITLHRQLNPGIRSKKQPMFAG